MRRFRMWLALIVLALAVAFLAAPSASALECVGVSGVFRYCPGRHCVEAIQPCD